MTPDEELIAELKKINHKLNLISNPFSNAWFNFRSGIFHSLGSLFGTVVIAAIIVYLLSQLKLDQLFTNWFQDMVSSTVDKVVPRVNPTNPFGL